ncbi:trans-cinnamate:CoA ligase, peroxisomal-like [Salvia divinorum]|uniref:Trans-cinnamate:CoA ligase, peroxisomal-like n=1 Tax=Salvia divinorum TaxID=28513 RepID=A0ABD1FV63_SALDI
MSRCCRLASALNSLNIVNNGVVSVLAPNIPALYEIDKGAVLNAINTRLDAKTIATFLKHSEAKIFFIDYEFVQVARDALRLLMASLQPAQVASMPLVVVIDDIDSPTGIRLGKLEYEALLSEGNPRFLPPEIRDEWSPIALIHLRHDVGAKGSGVQPPRRVPEHPQPHPRVGDADRAGLHVVPSYVPLQRLEFYVGGGGARQHQRLHPLHHRS